MQGISLLQLLEFYEKASGNESPISMETVEQFLDWKIVLVCQTGGTVFIAFEPSRKEV